MKTIVSPWMNWRAPMRRLKPALLAMIVALAACKSNPPPRPELRDLGFSRAAPLLLSAESIELVEQYKSPGKAPNVEQDFDVTPASAVREWVAARLRADGTPGVARVLLLDARVVREELPLTTGIKDLLANEQKYRYQGRIHIRIDLQPATASQGPAHVEAESTGMFTVPEGVTVQNLELEMFDMVQRMIDRLDLETQASMLRHMQGRVR